MADGHPRGRSPDSLRRFLFEHSPVRGEVVHLDAAWREVLERQDYPEPIRQVLGEALAAVVLLSSTLKFDGVLTLQLQGDGPMYLLVAECASNLTVRGLAKWKGDLADETLQDLVGEARLVITIEPEKGKQRYQGIVPLEGPDLSRCIEAYFRTSEQLPTRLWLYSDLQSAGGLLLQQLPEADSPDKAEDWNRLQILADTVTGEEVLGLAEEALLRRLFNEEDVRLFEGAPLAFRCSCTRDRVNAALQMLGRAEVSELAEDHGGLTVRCEFCNRAYPFDAVDVEQLFAGDQGTPPPPSSRVH